MADKDTLITEINELKTQLLPQLEHDKNKFAKEGRPFDTVGWVAGKPDDHKYPAGPAFLPLGANPTLKNAILNISVQDLSATVLASVGFYALGYVHAPKLNVTGHRLGFWLTVPALIIGLSAGTQKGFYRYLGFTNNGNPTLYPNYKEDSTPYFLRHQVSDRHFNVSPNAHAGNLK